MLPAGRLVRFAPDPLKKLAIARLPRLAFNEDRLPVAFTVLNVKSPVVSIMYGSIFIKAIFYPVILYLVFFKRSGMQLLVV
jgi:hypothetical protein